MFCVFQFLRLILNTNYYQNSSLLSFVQERDVNLRYLSVWHESRHIPELSIVLAAMGPKGMLSEHFHAKVFKECILTIEWRKFAFKSHRPCVFLPKMIRFNDKFIDLSLQFLVCLIILKLCIQNTVTMSSIHN